MRKDMMKENMAKEKNEKKSLKSDMAKIKIRGNEGMGSKKKGCK